MITEAVVSDPGSYPDCGRYLGDLFGGSKPSTASQKSATSNVSSSTTATDTTAGMYGGADVGGSTGTSERYSY